MPISGKPTIPWGGKATPKIDLSGCVLYLPLWRPDMVAKGGLIVNGTGICTGSPLYLAVGTNTVDVTQAGNFTVTMPEGGTVATGTMTVTGSPVTITAGVPTTVTTTGATGNITCTVSNIIRSKDTNNLAATITGATWGYQGRTFNGTTDYIALPDNLFASVTKFTIFLWLYPTDIATNKKSPFGGGAATWNSIPTITHNVSKYRFVVYHSSETIADVSTTDNALLNQWESLCYVYDGLNIPVYRQGILTGTGAALDNKTLDATSTGNRLGGGQTANVLPYVGTIGELLIYYRDLSAVEIMNLYLATKWRYK